ncbi:MAG: GH3 auxin-responsive promoter family protein [Lachnospiraceae bacterium]|nr:GH3 auxin-responsive promoter family protein [Lachnospiraceae bacterium]
MGKAYKVSVITPFHNTRMDLFKRTYASMREQTVGFDNIEWIIVLHNCNDESKANVRGLLGHFPNVVIKELENEVHSASAPRNFAFQFATAPYLMFIDSDDTYYPNTIEVCLQKMAQHKPQIVIFRMAFLKENDSVQEILTDRALWNPLVEEVVLEGKDKYCEELYSTIQFSGSNKMFSRDLIESNGIRFDEKINMAEDAYFVMQCYEKAAKIVVLPQFVGHCYFLNSRSSVQSADKPREAILQFTYGYKLMFDLMMKCGADPNHFILTMLQASLMMAYGSSSFTLEDWRQFQDDMRPYVENLTPPPVNKFFTKEEGQRVYEFVRKNILEPKTEASLQRHDYLNGEEVLLKIILENKNTDFGRFYDFEKIDGIEAYQHSVPLYEHEAFDKLIRIQTTVGEKNVLTGNRISAYAYDINESDEVKTVPVSEETCLDLGRGFTNTIADQVTFMMMEALPKGRLLNDYTYNDSMTGIMVYNSLGKYSLGAMDIPGKLTSPFALIFPKQRLDVEYLNILFALRSPDLTQIVAGNTWVVLNYFERLFAQTEAFCDAIENGAIEHTDADTKDFAAQLPALWIPDKARAALIREAIKTLPKPEAIKAIWPKLGRIMARDGGCYALYAEQLKAYVGDLPVVPGALMTPFGVIAKPVAGEPGYQLDLQKAFYEFLPVEQTEEEVPVLLSDLVCGRIYELVITNQAGVYRLRTYMCIKPVKMLPDTLYFVECERPVCHEGRVLCTDDDIYGVLKEHLGQALYDYSFHFRPEDKKLSIFVELDAPVDQNAGYGSAYEAKGKAIEQALMAKAGLDHCRVHFIDKESRLMLRDIRRFEYDLPADCVPPVRHLTDRKVVACMEAWHKFK